MNASEQELIARLSRYANNEKKAGECFEGYSPDRILQAKKLLGNPDLALETIHVAGTNGKGSVCHMLAQVLTESGYKTGLYTSPHLESVCERISIDGVPITPDELLSIIGLIEMSLAGKNIPLTWFDMMTLAAFLHFSNNWVDAAVIETGLGGRLDSTNIITPAVTVITEISLDHRHILGDTIELIAAEKAGIMKPGIPCVTTNAPGPAATALLSHARKTGAHLSLEGQDYHCESASRSGEGISFDYRDDGGQIRGIALPFKGLFQARNASAAIRALRLLGVKFPGITEQSIREGLMNTRVPGRMETLSESPLVIFDPAHNRQALESLCDTLVPEYGGDSLVFYVSFMADKEPEELAALLRSRGARIIYCLLDDERAFHPSAGTFERMLPPGPLKLAEEIRANGGVSVVTGTFRIYAAAKAAVRLLLDNASSGGN